MAKDINIICENERELKFIEKYLFSEGYYYPTFTRNFEKYPIIIYTETFGGEILNIRDLEDFTPMFKSKLIKAKQIIRPLKINKIL